MKIFLDTAHVDSIKKWAVSGLIDGITTNPTSLSKEGKKPSKTVLAICDAFPFGPVSIEVTEKDPKEIYFQARKIAALSSNITVKIPCHPDYYSVIKQLVEEGIKLNITLIFSLTQGLMMAKLGVTYISPFVGRLNEHGGDGIKLISNLRRMLDWYDYDTQLLAASIRNMEHFEQVINAGSDIATLSVRMFEDSINHELTDKGIVQFLADWKTLHISHFP